MQCNEQSTAKEQGNDREQDSEANIASPVRIGRKAQVGQASHVADAQKRPKQEHGGDQDGAVKERVEIIFRQKREHAVSCKGLNWPIKNRSKQRSDDENSDKIGC